MPHRPALPNVDGLPQATHNGGCPARYGLGKMLCGVSTEKCWPLNVYDSVAHMRGSWRMTSSHSLRVDDVSWMLNVATSWLPAPRPVPNSKRPALSWSTIAARSALRTGWFTRGLRLKMPDPRWIREVRPAR